MTEETEIGAERDKETVGVMAMVVVSTFDRGQKLLHGKYVYAVYANYALMKLLFKIITSLVYSTKLYCACPPSRYCFGLWDETVTKPAKAPSIVVSR